FLFLAENPYAGRARDGDLGPGRRSFPADRYVIVYRVADRDVVILRVAHGSRDIQALRGGGNRPACAAASAADTSSKGSMSHIRPRTSARGACLWPGGDPGAAGVGRVQQSGT